MTEHTDIDLLNQVGQHDQQALIVLYQRYGSLVYSLALQTLHQPVLAEEVTQDVFLKLWQQPARWNPELGQLSSWLLAITRNASIDRLRREARHQATDIDMAVDMSVGPAPVQDLGMWADGQLLRELLRELPRDQRELIELAFYRGYTHSELSAGLGVPLGTVKTRLRAGMQKLRVLWEQANPETGAV